MAFELCRFQKICPGFASQYQQIYGEKDARKKRTCLYARTGFCTNAETVYHAKKVIFKKNSET